MKNRWILIALSVGLLAAAITGGVALAWGGPGNGWGRGDHDSQLTALAGKVAGILGTDEQETADAITQAHKELRQESADEALQNVAGRVAESLGTDADTTAEAIKEVAEAMSSEALETKLSEAIDNGDMTEDEAQEVRNQVEERGWHGVGFNFKDDDTADDFATRVADKLEVEADDFSDALEQALSDIRSEGLESKLQAAIDSGRITEDEAAEIRQKIESGEWNGFGRRGRRGHHRGNGADDDSSSDT